MYKYKILYIDGTSEVKTFDSRYGLKSVSAYIVDDNKHIPVMGYKKI